MVSHLPYGVRVSKELAAHTDIGKPTVWQLCLIWLKGRDEGNGASLSNHEDLMSHTAKTFNDKKRRLSSAKRRTSDGIVVARAHD